MESNQTVLRIFGGSLGSSFDPKPLVSVGPLPQGFVPTPPILVDEPQSWMIVHAQEYTLYALYTRNIHTAEDAPGMLLICVFVPPQQRLGDGKSPLTMLESLLDNFRVIGAPEGRLPVGELDNSPFRVMMKLYPLEERPVLLPIMQGPESACFCVESHTQLDALMRYSRYDVLGKVGRLELGFHCESTVAISTTGKAVKKKEAPKEEAPKAETPKAEAPKEEPKPEVKPKVQKEAPKAEPKPEPKPEPKVEKPAEKPTAEVPPMAEPAPKKKSALMPILYVLAGVAATLLVIWGLSWNEPETKVSVKLPEAEESPAQKAIFRLTGDARSLVTRVNKYKTNFVYSQETFPIEDVQALMNEYEEIKEDVYFTEIDYDLQESVNSIPEDLYALNKKYINNLIESLDYQDESSLNSFERYFYNGVKDELYGFMNVYDVSSSTFDKDFKALKNKLFRIHAEAEDYFDN